MTRKEITAFLGNLLEKDRFAGIGKYYAKEVTLDYGRSEMVDDGISPAEECIKSRTKRIDYLQFLPENQLSVGGIEKGIFICYEIKSCKADYLSGFGQNYVGEKNYIVMPMSTYKELDQCGEINKLPYKVGILVPIPKSKKYSDSRLKDEYDKPTALSDCTEWYLETLRPSHKYNRERSAIELLFCMVRSGK